MKAPFTRHSLAVAAALGGMIRARTLDHLTFDQSAMAILNPRGDQRGKTFDHAYKTYDGKTYDSTGAFLVGELERLDPTIHMPLVEFSYSRDIDMRTDVTIGDEISSFTLSNFASPGGLGAGHGIRNGKAWIGKSSDQIGGVDIDIGKFPQPLHLWGLEIKYTIPELESAARTGRPLDSQKLDALKHKHQMDIDEQVYVGDANVGATGLLNSASVTNLSNVPNGAMGSAAWSTKTPDEILADINALITSTWTASGWKVMPNRILIPPTQFGYISTQKVSSAGNISILKYVLENNVLKASGKGELTILPCKWCIGAGVGGTIGTPGNDRMVAYTKDYQYVRFPMTALDRTPVQYDSLYHKTTYYGRLGMVEFVYPETIGYRDGL